MISVFGSTGFIGSNFVSMFKEECVSIPRSGNKSCSDDVLYMISTTDNYNIFDNPTLDVDTNIIKLICVLEDYKKSGRRGVFNFVSSWFVYGANSTVNTTESTPCDPRGFYSITKRTAEQMLVSYCETFDIEYRILRLASITGRIDHRASGKKNAIQYLFELLATENTVGLYDEGHSIRDFMHVDDCCRAIMDCIRCNEKNLIVNISNSNPLTIKDAIEYGKTKLESSSKIASVNTPAFHKVVQVKDVCLNNQKLLSLGYRPKMTALEALDCLAREVKRK
jgi:nucleoside-diphosphate-sugar epimerase